MRDPKFRQRFRANRRPPNRPRSGARRLTHRLPRPRGRRAESAFEGIDKTRKIGLSEPQPIDNLNQAKVHYILETEKLYSFLDSYSVCQFIFGPSWQLYSTSQLQEAIKAINGWDVSIEEMMEVGARRLNLLRAFNAREGITREDERIPKKLKTALKGGASDGVFVTDEEVEQAKDWYYEEAGWDVATGTPTRETLTALGLEWVAELL